MEQETSQLSQLWQIFKQNIIVFVKEFNDNNPRSLLLEKKANKNKQTHDYDFMLSVLSYNDTFT